MKLHNLITSITEAQAVQYYSSGDKNVVAYYDGEYYSVDNFGCLIWRKYTLCMQTTKVQI